MLTRRPVTDSCVVMKLGQLVGGKADLINRSKRRILGINGNFPNRGINVDVSLCG
jgi:hypothetical protein